MFKEKQIGSILYFEQEKVLQRQPWHSRREKKALQLRCLSFAPNRGKAPDPSSLTIQQGRSAKAKHAVLDTKYDSRAYMLRNNILPQPRIKVKSPIGAPAPQKTFQLPTRIKPFLMAVSSALVLECTCQVSGIENDPAWLPLAVGGLVGAEFALLGFYAKKRYWQRPLEPLRVVITGSTKGIGKAMARAFLMKGDSVMVTSRNSGNIRRAVGELLSEVRKPVRIFGTECDVGSPKSVKRLANEAKRRMGHVDVWINNAGNSGSYQDLSSMSSEQVEAVVNTNLLGSMLCYKAAHSLMASQGRGGHIFNMTGAGADGSSTPQYAAYGATKAAISHLTSSLRKELRTSQSKVKVHNVSPGMVLTSLLLDGTSIKNKFFFNILCVLPETSAAFLVPRIRSAAAGQKSGRYIQFLTPLRAICFLLTAPLRINKFFDKKGQPMYPDEQERFSDRSLVAKWLKDSKRLAIQDGFLAVAYSTSLATAYILFQATAYVSPPVL